MMPPGAANTETRAAAGQRVKKDVVLIVDDSPETLSMMNDTLEHAGVTVLLALEGSQALTIARSITPDVILMDAIMPHMDGFQTCKALKADRSLCHIPVIFMTGLADTESIVKGFEHGGVDYITKPVNGDELIVRMKAHLANARLTQNARTALDNTGQHLFAASVAQGLLWATPQAYQLFEKAQLDNAWLTGVLPGKLKTLLAPHYNREKQLLLETSAHPVAIQYMSQTDNDEYLLQLVDLERPSDVQILKGKLPLTDREAEVLLWIARGKTNREIGSILEISPRTINKHLEQVFNKLYVGNRTAAAIIALKYLENEG